MLWRYLIIINYYILPMFSHPSVVNFCNRAMNKKNTPYLFHAYDNLMIMLQYGDNHFMMILKRRNDTTAANTRSGLIFPTVVAVSRRHPDMMMRFRRIHSSQSIDLLSTSTIMWFSIKHNYVYFPESFVRFFPAPCQFCCTTWSTWGRLANL